MSKEIEDLRGGQVTIGTLVIHFPVERPDTDDQIIDREETIAAIKSEISSPQETVRLGKGIMAALRDDVTETMRKRAIEERTGVTENRFPLTREDEGAPPKKKRGAKG